MHPQPSPTNAAPSGDGQVLRGISSMATRLLLEDLARQARAALGLAVQFESVGGVEAAKRVAAGERFDLVVLADDAIERLADAGHVRAASRTPLVRSEVAVAVRLGAPKPDIGSEAALREAVRHAASIGYSTGPSGTALMKLFERWGLADALRGRLVQATPGVPVGSLLARGEVALAFQQRSELMNLPGIELIGGMPPEVPIVTTFTAAVAGACQAPEAAARLLAWLASPATAETKLRHGMSAA